MYTDSSKIVERSGNVPVDNVVTHRGENHYSEMPLTELEQRQLAAWNATQQNYPGMHASRN